MDGGNKKTQEGQDAEGWQYTPAGSTPENPSFEDLDASYTDTVPGGGSVEWSASEFIAHDKGFGWYVSLGICAVIASAVMYILTRDVFSTTIVVLLAIIVGVIGARKPRTVSYSLTDAGVKIGSRFHSFADYKSFTIETNGPFMSIVLLPMQRFGFALSMYLAPENENEVLELIGRHLPLEQGKTDAIERLMHHLRF